MSLQLTVNSRLQNQRFNVRELLAAVRAAAAEASRLAGIPIDLAVDPTVPLELIGDAPKIRQVLSGYLDNALKYAGRGRVTLSAFAALCGDDRFDLTLMVGDEGPGIEAGRQAQLFAGRSLAVCRALADEMGGTTLVRSGAGQGAVFYLRVPLAVPEAAADPLPVDLTFAGPLYALVVEAQEFSSAGLVALLRQLRIEVEVASSAEAALERCRTQAFALFFLDQGLPGLSGVELTRELRRREAGERRAVIIATSGAVTPQEFEEFLEAGMDGFLPKPFALEELRTALGQWFGHRPGQLPVRPPLGPGRLREPWRLDTLRYMANGDERELARRTRRYLRDLESTLLELQSALDQSHVARLQQSARKLVAHLNIIEHTALVSAVQEIEEAAVNRDLASASAKWAEVLVGVRQVRTRLVSDAESTPSE